MPPGSQLDCRQQRCRGTEGVAGGWGTQRVAGGQAILAAKAVEKAGTGVHF